jgi:hypothetical protein
LASTDKGLNEFRRKDGDNHLIIPVDCKTGRKDRNGGTSQIDYNTFARARRFSKGASIERDYEVTLLRHYLPTATVDYPSNMSHNFYNSKEFEIPSAQ